MIRAVFFESEGIFNGFRISGHAGYAVRGKDVVCSAVSSAVQLSANLITDAFCIPANVWAKDNAFECRVISPDSHSSAIIDMLKTHLEAISGEFPGAVKITIRRCKL